MPDTAIEDFKTLEYEEIEKSGQRKVWPLGTIRLYECPVTWITQESIDMMDACFMISNSSSLLFPGAWSDQPMWLWEAFKIYKTETNKTDGN